MTAPKPDFVLKGDAPDFYERLSGAMKRPEGTFTFTFSPAADIGDPAQPGGLILERVSGQHYFRLERGDDAFLRFYHSSPGTGTRVAEIDARPFSGTPLLRFFLLWYPDNIELIIGKVGDADGLTTAKGTIAPMQFRVDAVGTVVQLGGPGINVVGTRLTSLGNQLLRPTAIENWNETKKAIDIHRTGKSTEGRIYEIVSANLALCMMVTGFESYCKTRFGELSGEGIEPKASSRIRDYGKVNFQDFADEAKKAFKDAFGIDFGNLGLNQQEMKKMKLAFAFRHRIIHASPLIGQVNELAKVYEKPVFSDNAYQAETIELFNRFIENLHEATLALRP